MFTAIAPFAFVGYVLLALALVSFVLSLLSLRSQRAFAAASELDDPDEDENVQALSRRGRLFLWLFVVLVIVGAVIAGAPQWALVLG